MSVIAILRQLRSIIRAELGRMRLWLLCGGVATRADDIAESYLIGGHIRNRRAKLETFGWPRSITTVPGHSYRFYWQSQRPVEVTA